MFESIAIRSNTTFNDAIDIGSIAEALVFYGQSQLFLTEGQLTGLVARVGLDTLLALVEAGFVRAIIFRDRPAVHQVNTAAGVVYDFITVQRSKSDRPALSRLEVVQGCFERAGVKKGTARRAAYRFLNNAIVSSVNDGLEHEKGICEFARADLDDRQFVHGAIGDIVRELSGEGPPPGWQFEVRRDWRGTFVESNLDLRRLSALASSRRGENCDVTIALLLGWIQEARLDLFLAARQGAELMVSSISGALIQRRLRALGLTLDPNRAEDLVQFQRMVTRGRSIGEAVRSGHKSLDQVVKLADKAQRFRGWLSERPVDSELIEEYYTAVTRETWVDRLPGRELVFAVFAGLGVVTDLALSAGLSTAVGLALDSVDHYLVSRLGGGWKPSQFVGEDLVAFVEGSKRNTRHR
jgi:hypothetical protein